MNSSRSIVKRGRGMRAIVSAVGLSLGGVMAGAGQLGQLSQTAAPGQTENVTAQAGTPAAPAAAPTLSPAAAEMWRTLTAADTPMRERQAAAARLLDLPDPAVGVALRGLLRTGSEGQAAQEGGSAPGLSGGQAGLPASVTGLLRAVASRASAPAWLAEPLAELRRSAGDRPAPAVLAALASVRTREAFEAVLEATANGSDQAASPDQVEARERRRAAAFDALERLTGRSEIASTSAAWEEWFGPLRFAPEAAWTAALAEGLAERADAVSATLNSTVTRLVDSLRRGYLDTPEGQRPARLVSLLGDEMTQVRTLGLELVERDLANARPLGDAVVNAVIPLLRDDEPAVRARAAGVLGRVAPMTAARPVAEALSAEQQPGAAAALLAAAVRWPEAAMTPAVVTWLRVPGPTRQAAEKLANRLLALPETSTEQAKQLRAALAATPS